MKVWPIDPLVPRHLRLEVPEKLPQGLTQLSLNRVRPGYEPSGATGNASGSGNASRQPRGEPAKAALTLGKMQAPAEAGPEVRAILAKYTAGHKELACGSQAFIATLLFDPSMSALPIIPKQNSVSVGLFTH